MGVVVDEDATDLLQLARAVPLAQFTAHDRLVLNPLFGAGWRVGGADADLIIDGTLIEIKTSLHLKVRMEYLHQLSGYLALAHLGGVHGAGDAPLERVGVYFARHGVLHTWALDDLYAPGGLNTLLAWLDGDWSAGTPLPVRPARIRRVGERGAADEPWTIIPGYVPLPGAEARPSTIENYAKRRLLGKPAVRSGLIARRVGRALLGLKADPNDVWLVAVLLAACPVSQTPLTFLQDQLADVDAARRHLSGSHHSGAWSLNSQPGFDQRCRRVQQEVQASLAVPLRTEEADVLAGLLPCPALLEEQLTPTRTARSAVRRLVERGMVLQDGRLIQRLDESRCCPVPLPEVPERTAS